MELHWSVDHDHPSQRPEYGDALREALHAYGRTPPPDTGPVPPADNGAVSSRYTILPNFWKGYKGRECVPPTKGFEIGHAEVERRLSESGIWRYAVTTLNTTSGARTALSFHCDDGPWRCLRNGWEIAISNTGPGQFSRRRIRCSLGPDMRVVCRDLAAGAPGAETGCGESSLSELGEVVCNWTLFDLFRQPDGERREAGEFPRLTVVEELEIVRRQVAVVDVGSWRCSDSAASIDFELAGYCISGTGLPPSYWWTDRWGRVVVVSTIFETMVMAKQGTEAGA